MKREIGGTSDSGVEELFFVCEMAEGMPNDGGKGGGAVMLALWEENSFGIGTLDAEPGPDVRIVLNDAVVDGTCMLPAWRFGGW